MNQTLQHRIDEIEQRQKKDSERLNRIETRLTKLMVYSECDPYNIGRLTVTQNSLVIRDKSVTVFELCNAVKDRPHGAMYSIILNGQSIGSMVI